MSDIVQLEIIKTGFWVLIFCGGGFFFRAEVRQLVQSLTSFKVAGATFELKDKNETIRSYILLAETLVDILSRGEHNDALLRLLYPSQIEKLGTFALKYTKEVPEDNWSDELLKNVAYLLLRHGRFKQSVELYDALLKKRPDHMDLLNLKALAFMTSRLPKNIKIAEEVLFDLVNRYPEIAHIRFNLALTLSLREKSHEAVKEMKKVIDVDYWKTNNNLLMDPLFHYVRESQAELFDGLKIYLSEAIEKNNLITGNPSN